MVPPVPTASSVLVLISQLSSCPPMPLTRLKMMEHQNNCRMLRHTLAAESANPFSQFERHRQRLQGPAPGRIPPPDAGDSHA